MATIKETAQAFVPTQIKNISELPQIPIDLELYDAKGIADDGKEFSYKYALLNNEKYRVPNLVIGQIKDILEESPKVIMVRVKKTGQGLQSRYTTVPIMQ